MGTGRLYGLDALRGTAALIILIFHTTLIYGGVSFIGRAYLIVDLFFMLSGYVMARSYEAQFRKVRSGSTLLACRYFLSRFKRFWMPVAIGAILGATLMTATGNPLPMTALSLAFALVMLPNFFPIFGDFRINGSAWSLCFELFANFLHALVFWRLGSRALLIVVLICAAILSLWAGDLNVGSFDLFWLGVPRVLMSYCIGIVIWRSLGDQPQWPLWPALICLPAMIAPHAPRLDFLVVVICCPPVLICSLGLKQQIPFARMASAIGTLSFPLYAVHYPLIQLAYRFDAPWWVDIALSLLLASLISATLRHAQSRNLASRSPAVGFLPKRATNDNPLPSRSFAENMQN